MASNFEPSTFEQACIEARRWIEEVTELCFSYEDFRKSLRDGVLLCKLAEKLSGVNIGELSPIPRSLAWMDNLTIFLNVCHYMGMKKSQLFCVDDLAAVRNQDLPLKIKQREESRRIRNVLITIFWLGKLAYSLKNYQGPLPDLDSFENLINKRRPPEMVDQRRNKFELDTLSGSDTWPRFKRSSKPSPSSRVNEGSLEYFEQMRQELIPHLSAKVKEKTSMYDRKQREAKQEEIYPKEKVRRNRSATNPLPGRGFPEKARRAYSSGTLAAVNDEKTNKAKVETYYSVGSITRRTPIKVIKPVVQKERVVQHGKSEIASMSGVKHRSGQSFQYDKKPVVNEEKKITNVEAHTSKYKSAKKNESVSVTTLIHKWSNAEGKVNKEDKTSDSASTNRRSLPANFAMNSNLPVNDEPQLRRTESVSTCKYDKTQTNYPTKTSGLQSEKSGSRSTGHTTVTKMKSEPVKIYTTSDRSIHPPPETKKEGTDRNERSSWYQNETAKNEKWMPQDTKRYPPNSSFLPSSEKEREIFREIQSEYHHPKESVVDRNAIGKYATMPIRQRKSDQNQSIKKNETNKAERGFENRKDDLIGANFNTSLSHASNNRLQKNKSSFHHLPSYAEAIKPLHETEVNEEPTGGKQEKLRIERSSTTSAPHHFISPKESSNGKTKELRNRETKQPIKENVVKHHVLDAKTVPELDSLFSIMNLERDATKRPERLVNRDNQHEGLGVPVVGKTVDHYNSVTSPNESNKFSSSVIKSSNLMTQSSHSKNRTDGVKEVSLNRDINHNLSTIYDNELDKTMLAPRQRRRESASSRAEKDIVQEDMKRRNDGSFSQESRYVKINEVKALKEQERLRQQQKIILDEDFKERGSSRMTPDVVQQLTKPDGMSFSNVVHDKELVQLVAAEEKYWKEKIEKKDQVSEDGKKKKLEKTDEKQQRVDEMLREFKLQDRKYSTRVGCSEMTDTLRAEEEFLAQEAEKLLKLRFQEKSVKSPPRTSMLCQVDGKCEHETPSNDERKLIKSSIKYNLMGPLLEKTKETHDNVTMNTDSPRSSVTTVPPTSKKSPSTSSDDIKLQPEADQAYHNQPRRISRSQTPVYMCSGCRLPVQRDICLFVSELQSYWHEKCFRCSVCHSSLIRGRSTPKIRVMFSKIHCENCLSNKKTGGQSTVV